MNAEQKQKSAADLIIVSSMLQPFIYIRLLIYRCQKQKTTALRI
jgi:hypothetical protein